MRLCMPARPLIAGALCTATTGAVAAAAVAQTPAQILERYTFFSHVGNACALWRNTHPADFWRHWQAQHPTDAVSASTEPAKSEH